MNLNKVAAICKKHKQIHIHNDPNTGMQWLGDGTGMYLLEGMPRLTTDECLRLFDVPKKKHHAYYCQVDNLPEGIDFSDEAGVNSEDLRPYFITIGRGNESFQVFNDGSTLYAINETYLTPFAGNLEYVKYHKREIKGGTFMLGINVGLLLQAVIAPYLLHWDEPLVNDMRRITEGLQYMQKNHPRPSAE